MVNVRYKVDKRDQRTSNNLQTWLTYVTQLKYFPRTQNVSFQMIYNRLNHLQSFPTYCSSVLLHRRQQQNSTDTKRNTKQKQI